MDEEKKSERGDQPGSATYSLAFLDINENQTKSGSSNEMIAIRNTGIPETL